MKEFPSSLAQIWHQNLNLNVLKTSKIEARGGYPIGLWDQKWTKFRSWVLLWLLGCLGGVLGASWGRFGTVLSGSWVPTWVPKWNQLGQKIDPKSDHVLDASWNRFLGGFSLILDAKIIQRSVQNEDLYSTWFWRNF